MRLCTIAGNVPFRGGRWIILVVSLKRAEVRLSNELGHGVVGREADPPKGCVLGAANDAVSPSYPGSSSRPRCRTHKS